MLWISMEGLISKITTKFQKILRPVHRKFASFISLIYHLLFILGKCSLRKMQTKLQATASKLYRTKFFLIKCNLETMVLTWAKIYLPPAIRWCYDENNSVGSKSGEHSVISLSIAFTLNLFYQTSWRALKINLVFLDWIVNFNVFDNFCSFTLYPLD